MSASIETSEREAVAVVAVPRELLERASASIGAFCSDQGWADSDMNTLDSVLAVLAQALKSSPVAPLQVSTSSVLVGQLLVLSELLGEAIEVVKNVEAESTDEDGRLQKLIRDSEAARSTIVREQLQVWAPGRRPPMAENTKRIGKKAAGRALDGRTWDEVPA